MLTPPAVPPSPWGLPRVVAAGGWCCLPALALVRSPAQQGPGNYTDTFKLLILLKIIPRSGCEAGPPALPGCDASLLPSAGTGWPRGHGQRGAQRLSPSLGHQHPSAHGTATAMSPPAPPEGARGVGGQVRASPTPLAPCRLSHIAPWGARGWPESSCRGGTEGQGDFEEDTVSRSGDIMDLSWMWLGSRAAVSTSWRMLKLEVQSSV